MGRTQSRGRASQYGIRKCHRLSVWTHQQHLCLCVIQQVKFWEDLDTGLQQFATTAEHQKTRDLGRFVVKNFAELLGTNKKPLSSAESATNSFVHCMQAVV